MTTVTIVIAIGATAASRPTLSVRLTDVAGASPGARSVLTQRGPWAGPRDGSRRGELEAAERAETPRASGRAIEPSNRPSRAARGASAAPVTAAASRAFVPVRSAARAAAGDP